MIMSKERELLKRWLAGEANQIPTHVPLLIETQNLLAQPEALAPEREFIRLWYENIELWKVHAKELLAQPEQNKAEAIMPNGGCVSNVYAVYEEGRKSAMAGQEPLTNEQKSVEAALEQALKDTVDEERIRQIFINCISFN